MTKFSKLKKGTAFRLWGKNYVSLIFEKSVLALSTPTSHQKTEAVQATLKPNWEEGNRKLFLNAVKTYVPSNLFFKEFSASTRITRAFLWHYQTSMMELFANIVERFIPPTIFIINYYFHYFYYWLFFTSFDVW